MSVGRLFHTCGAATADALSPSIYVVMAFHTNFFLAFSTPVVLCHIFMSYIFSAGIV